MVSVNLDGSLSTMSGHRKSSQAPMKAKIATTAMVPFTDGSAIRRNRCHTLAPSTKAASSISYGRLRKALRISRTFIAPMQPGRTTPIRVLLRPSSRMVVNWAMMMPSTGTSIARMKTRVATRRPR